MNISITGFRCHRKSEFSFSGQGATLICGESGIGKSSILEAVAWCLYGQMQHVYSHGNEKSGECHVTLTFTDGLAIYRQKRPELLRVMLNNTTYEDEVAQGIIDVRFGNKTLWRATSYIKQGERCSLLSSSKAERVSILQELTFKDVNVDKHLERIEATHQDCNNSINKLSSCISQSTGELHALPLITGDWLELDLDKIKQEGMQLMQVVSQLGSRLHGNTANKTLRDDIQKRLEDLKRNELPLTEPEIEKEIRTTSDLIISQCSKDKNAVVQNEIDSLNNKITSVTVSNVTNKMIQESLQQKLLLEDLRRYKEPETELQLLLTQVKNNEIATKVKDRLNLYEQYVLISKDLVQPVPSLDDINREEVKLTMMVREKAPLQCPSCNVALRYSNGVLSNKDVKVISDKEINDQRSVISSMRKQYDINANVNTLLAKMDAITDQLGDADLNVTYSPVDVRRVETLRSVISALQHVVEPKYSFEFLSNELRNNELIAKVKSLEDSKIRTNNTDSPDSPSVSVLMDRKRTLESELYRKKEIRGLSERLVTIVYDETLDTRYNEAKETCERLSKTYQEQIVLKRRRQLEEEIRTWQQMIENNVSRMTLVLRLRDHIITAENLALEQRVSEINSYMESILVHMFDEPIAVVLQCFKTLKSTKRDKPEVNLFIRYRDHEYSDISNMSGGEGDRVSLALSLSLNHVSGSGLMLIDEALQSISSDGKASCVEAFKNHVNPVIVVSHDDIAGYYDNVLYLN